MNYNLENDLLLNNLIEMRFLNEWKKDFKNKDKYKTCDLELYITPKCNLKCSYCYLNKYGSQLYPYDITDENMIIKNLEIILDWIIKNNYYIDCIELFSGEIWHTEFGLNILLKIYDYIDKYKFVNSIGIPSNMCFLLDDCQTDKIQNIINMFSNKDVRLFFSASIDGMIVEDNTRPFKYDYSVRDEEFYNKLFEFSIKNNFGFHPMVSAHSIEKWINNYKWWAEKYKENNLDITKLMMLEVRNNDWTPDKIQEYLKFLDFVIDFTFNECYNKDKYKMVRHIFSLDHKSEYNNLALRKRNPGFTCKIQDDLYVRLGDLAIVPCHRTSYDKFIYGKFVVKNNEIIGIEANNVELAIKILSSDPNYSQFKCGYCKINQLCSNGCLGSQYENSMELFYPCDTVCNLQIEKIKFLTKKYDDMGLFEYARNIKFNNIKSENIVKDMLKYIDKIKTEDSKHYE